MSGSEAVALAGFALLLEVFDGAAAEGSRLTPAALASAGDELTGVLTGAGAFAPGFEGASLVVDGVPPPTVPAVEAAAVESVEGV